MKRREFVRALTRQGCHLKRHGAKHDLYVNPATGQTAPVPRHPEIRDTLARGIRKQLVWTNAGKLRARRAYAPLPDASARAATHHLVITVATALCRRVLVTRALACMRRCSRHRSN